MVHPSSVGFKLDPHSTATAVATPDPLSPVFAGTPLCVSPTPASPYPAAMLECFLPMFSDIACPTLRGTFLHFGDRCSCGILIPAISLLPLSGSLFTARIPRPQHHDSFCVWRNLVSIWKAGGPCDGYCGMCCMGHLRCLCASLQRHVSPSSMLQKIYVVGLLTTPRTHRHCNCIRTHSRPPPAKEARYLQSQLWPVLGPALQRLLASLRLYIPAATRSTYADPTVPLVWRPQDAVDFNPIKWLATYLKRYVHPPPSLSLTLS